MSKDKQTLHIYIRVSTGGQEKDGTSLDSQLKLGKEKAKSLGMEYEVHDERSASSSKDNLENRPVIRELLARVSDGEIKNIYVYSIDRLSRNTTISTFIRETLRKSKCTLYTNTNETNLDSLEQNLLFGIISEISQYENMLRKERLCHGKRVKARQGYWMGGSTPFGYKTNKTKKLVLDKEQSPWVERIFKWYSQGLSPKRIKHKLDGSVLTNRGKPIWSYGSVEAILRNTHPNGSYVYYEKEIPCPRIVDIDTWDKVQERLKKSTRPKRPKQKNHDYPLRELMSCGHCDSVIWGESRKLKDDQFRLSYRCSKHNKKWKSSSKKGDWIRGKHCPNNVSMDCERTIEGIWETLVNVLELSHQEREIFKKSLLKQKNGTQEWKEKELARINKKIESTNETISRLQDSIEQKEIEKITSRDKAKPIQSFIDKLHTELNKSSLIFLKLENEKVVLEEDNLWIDWISDYETNIDKLKRLSDEEKIEVIKKYVKKIRVLFDSETRKHRLVLKLRLPIIEDSLKWKDKSKKKKGYVIEKGKYEKMVNLDNNVRNIRTMV